MSTSIPRDPNAPRVPVHPGGILADVLADRGITAAELADAAGLDLDYLNLVLFEALNLTPEASLRIARALGTSTGMWAGLQSDYDLDTARAALGSALDAVRVLPGPAVEAEPLPSPLPGMRVVPRAAPDLVRKVFEVHLNGDAPDVPFRVAIVGGFLDWSPAAISEVRADDWRVLWRAS